MAANASFWNRLGMAIPDTLDWLFRRGTSIPTSFIWTMFSLYVLVNGQSLLGERFGASVQWSVAVYLIMVGIFYTNNKVIQNPLEKLPIGHFLFIYAAVFLAAGAFVSAFFAASGFRPPELPTGTTTNAVQFFIVFLIAFPEELIFRDGIPLFLQNRGLKNPIAAQFVSAILFSVFHVTAYRGSFVAHLVAFLIGFFVFGLVREGFRGDGTRRRTAAGLVVAIALHSVYNAAVFGVFCFTCGGWDLFNAVGIWLSTFGGLFP